MITGFNTDIDFQGVVYHVQTEDKGLATPLILSLVYNRGTILASKRSPYDDLLEKGFDEKVLAERLQKQHKTICAAIRAGRIEELKEMTAKNSAQKVKPGTAAATGEKKSGGGEPAAQVQNTALPASQAKPAQKSQHTSNGTHKTAAPKENEKPIPKPKYDFSVTSAPAATGNSSLNLITAAAKNVSGGVNEELVIEAVEVIDAEMILPDEAVEIVTGASERKTAGSKLNLEILGDDTFRSGEKKTMTILVHQGDPQNGLGGAQVMIKVLGAAFRPLIFHGKTDRQGIAKVHLQMPLFKQGRAAILIKAMCDGEEIELRRTIKHR